MTQPQPGDPGHSPDPDLSTALSYQLFAYWHTLALCNCKTGKARIP